ncbi:MAG: class I SAM-dependent methyltransferase [Methanothrix sp.]|nr:class I SAM-dependent methyltransferase [Methanothrix sp.]
MSSIVDHRDRLYPLPDHLQAWDRDYARRGRVWGGSVKDLPALPEGSLVLEMGCGDGKALSIMPPSWRITAIDISQQALLLARRAKPDAGLLLADGCRLPLKSDRFNAIFAFHVAGHLFLDQRLALAKEAARVLRPGGRLFFRDFSREDMRMGRGEEVEEATFRRGSGIITHYFSEGEVAAMFSGLKMDLIRTQRWSMRIRGEKLLRSEVEAALAKSRMISE